jgi:hypothetical protein
MTETEIFEICTRIIPTCGVVWLLAYWLSDKAPYKSWAYWAGIWAARVSGVVAGMTLIVVFWALTVVFQ